MHGVVCNLGIKPIDYHGKESELIANVNRASQIHVSSVIISYD